MGRHHWHASPIRAISKTRSMPNFRLRSGTRQQPRHSQKAAISTSRTPAPTHASTQPPRSARSLRRQTSRASAPLRAARGMRPPSASPTAAPASHVLRATANCSSASRTAPTRWSPPRRSALGGGGSGTVSSGTQGQFAFYNAAGTTLTATSSLFLAQSGNIGIGTTTPLLPPDVAGFINTNQYSGFKQAGNTVLYASTTNSTLALGASAAAAWMSASSTGWNNIAIGLRSTLRRRRQTGALRIMLPSVATPSTTTRPAVPTLL